MESGATLYITKSEANPLLLERAIRYAIENKHMEVELERHLQERTQILESIQDGFLSLEKNWMQTLNIEYWRKMDMKMNKDRTISSACSLPLGECRRC